MTAWQAGLQGPVKGSRICRQSVRVAAFRNRSSPLLSVIFPLSGFISFVISNIPASSAFFHSGPLFSMTFPRCSCKKRILFPASSPPYDRQPTRHAEGVCSESPRKDCLFRPAWTCCLQAREGCRGGQGSLEYPLRKHTLQR